MSGDQRFLFNDNIPDVRNNYWSRLAMKVASLNLGYDQKANTSAPVVLGIKPSSSNDSFDFVVGSSTVGTVNSSGISAGSTVPNARNIKFLNTSGNTGFSLGCDGGNNLLTKRYDASGTLLGTPLTVSNSSGNVVAGSTGNSLSGNPGFIDIVGDKETRKQIGFSILEAGSRVPRVAIRLNEVAETGANAGSDLTIHTYTDAGGDLGNPILYMDRAGGFFTVGPGGNLASGSGDRLYVVGNERVTGNTVISGTVSASNLVSGTWVPTYVGITDVTSVTNQECQYIRYGSIVHFEIQASVVLTGTPTTFALTASLPVATTFTDVNQCGGVCTVAPTNVSVSTGYAIGVVGTNTILITYLSSADPGNLTIFVKGSYRIL